jgi:hypothetical protein
MRKILVASLLLCSAAPLVAVAADTASAPAAQPQPAGGTARFNMTQNGKRMTADDFDAWMKANGYNAGRRVETPAAVAPKPEPKPEAKAKTVGKKKKKK